MQPVNSSHSKLVSLLMFAVNVVRQFPIFPRDTVTRLTATKFHPDTGRRKEKLKRKVSCLSVVVAIFFINIDIFTNVGDDCGVSVSEGHGHVTHGHQTSSSAHGHKSVEEQKGTCSYVLSQCSCHFI